MKKIGKKEPFKDKKKDLDMARRRKRVSFYVKPRGSKRKKKVSFLARR